MSMDLLAREIHQTAVSKGFWEARNEQSFGAQRIALIHSELSEALEALRDDDLVSVEAELADVVIRVLDFAEGCGFSMDEAVARKMEKNEGRPHLHGRSW